MPGPNTLPYTNTPANRRIMHNRVLFCLDYTPTITCFIYIKNGKEFPCDFPVYPATVTVIEDEATAGRRFAVDTTKTEDSTRSFHVLLPLNHRRWYRKWVGKQTRHSFCSAHVISPKMRRVVMYLRRHIVVAARPLEGRVQVQTQLSGFTLWKPISHNLECLGT